MKRIFKQFLRRFEFGLIAVSLFAILLSGIGGTRLYGQSQAQDQTPAQVRSRAEETLEWWNQIGKKLIAMAKDFPEDKYDFKVQKDERTFAENLVHVAAVDYDIVSRVAGSHVGPDLGKDKHNPPQDMYKTKADVVKLLEDAVAAGGEGDSRTRRRGAGQNPVLWMGTREARRAQLLHLA